MTMAAAAPSVPPTLPPRSKWEVYVTVVIPIAALVVTMATIVISYQISRISDLGSDIKNVNTRVDQIYPLIAQSTADLGFIKGSLEATSQKITAAAEKNEATAKRLESLIASQEAQYNNIKQLTESVGGLVTSIRNQQQELDDIKSKIRFDPASREGLLFDATIFSPDEISKSIAVEKGSNVISIDWKDTNAAMNFWDSIPHAGIDFSKIVMSTKDEKAATGLSQALQKAGLLTKLQK